MAKGKSKEPPAALILSPYLYLGPRTSASSAFIQANGITHVLSIGSTPASTDSPVIYRRLALIDDPSCSITDVSNAADAFIESAKLKGGRILVHCSAAVSRSPTVVAAYLMKKCGMSLVEALGVIIRARPAVCPNSGFLKQLKELEVALRGSSSLQVDILPARKDQRQALFLAPRTLG
ncbi:hypothetical protein GALMADRAFT_69019 [Galerina marginata CBS 339.88]|uniref:protein-tyrosine-phosphatase n=1 Tax=Galerina marginata (strain CBS 339.88) TaxID=685588 RepID=A0A067T933_GALM3|nr:hypothetical protein GALMADRAFT_69019 [Galerina marginata CBS 339.88]